MPSPAVQAKPLPIFLAARRREISSLNHPASGPPPVGVELCEDCLMKVCFFLPIFESNCSTYPGSARILRACFQKERPAKTSTQDACAPRANHYFCFVEPVFSGSLVGWRLKS